MIQEENLDIRTITMGISLLDCCDSDIQKACGRIYEKITRRAERLVRTGEEIEPGVRHPDHQQAYFRHPDCDDLRSERGRSG